MCGSIWSWLFILKHQMTCSILVYNLAIFAKNNFDRWARVSITHTINAICIHMFVWSTLQQVVHVQFITSFSTYLRDKRPAETHKVYWTNVRPTSNTPVTDPDSRYLQARNRESESVLHYKLRSTTAPLCYLKVGCIRDIGHSLCSHTK